MEPDTLYSDETMYDIFPLIILSFAYLIHKSTNLHAKGVRILETMANMRYCIIMLDLDCEHILINIFQHFVLVLRETHSRNIFTPIETILTFIWKERDNISLFLITFLLESVQYKNKEVFLLHLMQWKEFLRIVLT